MILFLTGSYCVVVFVLVIYIFFLFFSFIVLNICLHITLMFCVYNIIQIYTFKNDNLYLNLFEIFKAIIIIFIQFFLVFLYYL